MGLVLQDQLKYDAAVTEFAKLFPSNVRDDELNGLGGEDYKNYRHKAALRISECYEEKKDYAQALDYALRARDLYKFLSWCSTCRKSANDFLSKRISKLEELAKKAN